MSDWIDAEQHVERAHEFYELGAWEDAETELRSAIALNPFESDWHFNLGLTLEAAGRHGDAAAAFAECSRLRGGDSPSLTSAGVNLLRHGDATAAVASLRVAHEADPTATEPLVHLVAAYTELGDHQQAESCFYLGQELDDQHAELYAEMAESLMARGLHAKAMWCLREAVKLDPELPGVEARLAEAHARTGRLERARQLYLRALRKDPGDIDTLLDLGDLLAEMQRPAEAAEKYRRVLELESDNADAYAGLGHLHATAGLAEEAVAAFDAAFRLSPSFEQIRVYLAEALLDRSRPGDTDRARTLAVEQLAALADPAVTDDAARSETAEHAVRLGELLLDLDEPEHAAEVYRRVRRRHPSDARAAHRLATALLLAGDARAGIAAAREALRLDPASVASMHNLAVAHLRLGQLSRAGYWLRQARSIAPDDPEVRRLGLLFRLHTLRVTAVSACSAAAAVLAGIVGLGRRPRRA